MTDDAISIPSHAVVGLGKALFPIFALALDLDENFFEDKVSSDRFAKASLINIAAR